MNNRLLIFLLVSVILHFFLFAILKVNVPEKQQPKPLYVDIIKKKNKRDKPEEKKAKKPVVLGEKNKVLSKKSKRKTKILALKKSPSVKQKQKEPKRKIVIPSKKKIPRKTEEKRKTVQKKLNEEKSVIKKGKVKEKEVEERKELKTKGEEKKLSKEQIAKILNPSNVISKYANPYESGSNEGEDEVDVRMMKFKYASYFKKFERRLYQVWHYPKDAAMRNEEGTVKIKFTILKDGTITNIKVVQSSGSPALDREAVKALKTMRGVPLPNSYGLKRLKVTGYFVYKLNYLFIY